MSVSEKLILENLSQLIGRNIGNSALSLDDICKELGISRSHLHRIVKEQTGLSTTLFIRRIRLEKAKELLSTTDFRITEIADKIGIDSPPNFSKYFLQTFDISPTDYRRLTKISANGEVSHKENQLVNDSFLDNSAKKNRFSAKIFLQITALLVLTAVVIYFGVINLKKAPNDKETSADYAPHYDNSIAVLPFQSLDNNAIFANGIFEEIHSSLSLIDNLKVIAQTSSNQYKDTKKTNWQIGDELQVAYLLQGKVKETNNRVKISLALIRAEDDIEVWTKDYEGELGNVFNLMNDIVKNLAAELKQEITPKLSQKLDRIPTKSIEAYNAFLQGQVLMKTRAKEKLAESLVKFDNALAIDPDFAEAYAYKAIAYHLGSNMGYTDTKTSFDLAEQSALAAIKIEVENGTAYATLGNIYRDQFKWQQAQTFYEIALKYKPNDAQTLYWYSLLLRSTGKLSAAIQYSTKAVTLDPLYPVILAGHIVNCAYAGKDSLAQKSIDEGRLIFDNSFIYYMGKGYFYLNKDDFAAALKEFKKVEELNPSMRYFNTMPAFCEAKLGHKNLALKLLKTYGNDPQDYISQSMLQASLGQKDSCLIYLQKAADLGVTHTDLLVHPAFKFVRQDARFKAVLQKFGLPTAIKPSYATID